MGPGSVFAARLDHLLLLHLEGSQVDRQGRILGYLITSNNELLVATGCVFLNLL